MNRCDECGSWEAECANPEPVSDCGCARCAVAARNALEAENMRLRGQVAMLREALEDYYHECRCRQKEIEEINIAARRALAATETP